MRWRTLPIELLLLAVLAVFLLYPIFYILPGAASDESLDVRITSLGETSAQKLLVANAIARQSPGGPPVQTLTLPHTVKSFPTSQKASAESLAEQFRQLGAGVEVVRQRHWTAFYFQQALGFRFERSAGFPYFTFVPSPTLMECLVNSLLLATLTTLATTLLCLPLAYWFARFQFRGRGLLATLLLVPLIFPPFVGAIGLARFLDRFGTLNLWLMQLGILDSGKPIDWLGEGGFFGVIVMQVLHLYPILYLNLAASWANVDPTLEDAARNLGAGEWRVFRTVTFPLLLPGYFAGAVLVFVWAFTDLGTPLVFNFLQVIPVKIFDQVSDPQRTNSVAYALVVVTLVVTGTLFLAARWLVGRRAYVSGGKGAMATVAPVAGRKLTAAIYATVLVVTLLAAVPNIGVVITACAERWTFTPLPQSYTTEYVREVWTNKIAALSIRNSLMYSAASTALDVLFGVTLAWLVARRPGWLSSVLEGSAMVPLALPGLVLAFGYLTCYSGWGSLLDPTSNPTLLLIIAYAVRRLPYLTRSALAGLQQIAPVLEEAAENLGASRLRVLRTVTLPLIAANLIAGCILTFAFAILEVSDSLMLAREEKYYPITRAILGLLMRPDDGDNIASALAVYAMVLLGVCLLVAGLLLGRKMGELFRA